MFAKNPLLAAATALVLSACGDAPAPIVPDETAKTGNELNTNAPDPKLYPLGPFGWKVDEVIPNLTFIGRADADGNGKVVDDPAVKINMSDYFGKKDIKLVALLFAAEWCPPCQQEQGELVTSWNRYQKEGLGVAYLEALTESADAKRTPADLGTIDRWTGKAWKDYQINKDGLYLPFPVVADPTKEALRLGASAIPTQMIIRTSDMRIMWFNQGYGKGTLEYNIDDQLSLL